VKEERLLRVLRFYLRVYFRTVLIFNVRNISAFVRFTYVINPESHDVHAVLVGLLAVHILLACGILETSRDMGLPVWKSWEAC
jgi:hypothetical protein